jgi:hypothetical protein
MARRRKKRIWIERPGMMAAAETLGCDYSHLRRCISGERQSRSLLRRYRQLKRAQRAAEATKSKS